MSTRLGCSDGSEGHIVPISPHPAFREELREGELDFREAADPNPWIIGASAPTCPPPGFVHLVGPSPNTHACAVPPSPAVPHAAGDLRAALVICVEGLEMALIRNKFFLLWENLPEAAIYLLSAFLAA